MRPSLAVAVLSAFLIVSLSACAAESDDTDAPLKGKKKGKDDSEASDPALCTSRSYTGFGKAKLDANRVVANVGVDRRRVKPFGALAGDYARVLGASPASLKTAAATFGEVERTWYEEPQSSAVAIQTAYSVAFEGCLAYTAKPTFDAAPDAASAPTQCAAMARAFWSKTPSPDEIAGCVDVTTKAAARQPARRAWAYGCAAVLTSADFLTY